MAKILQVAYGDSNVRVCADQNFYRLVFLSGADSLEYTASSRQKMMKVVDELRSSLAEIYYELTAYSGPFNGILDDKEGDKDDGQHEDL